LINNNNNNNNNTLILLFLVVFSMPAYAYLHFITLPSALLKSGVTRLKKIKFKINVITARAPLD